MVLLIVRVDEQRRFVIDPELLKSTLGSSVPTGQTVHLWAMAGRAGQLQLLGQNNELTKIREQYDALLSREPPKWDSGGDKDTATLRKLASLMPVSICAEKSRRKLRVTIPSEAVTLGFVNTTDSIVVLAVGEIVEIWLLETWRKTTMIEDVREFAKLANDLIDV